MQFHYPTVCLLGFQVLVSLASTSTSVLFRGGTIIAFNEDTNSLDVIRNGSLLIENDRITGLWAANEQHGVADDAEIIDVSGAIISPGFVDTHRHNWQTFFKTMGSNTTLIDYNGHYSQFLQHKLIKEDDIYISQLAGLLENLNAGVTTTLDHAHHTWSDAMSEAGLRASINSGARNFWSYGFHNQDSAYSVSDQINTFRRLAQEAAFNGTPTSLGIACDFFGMAAMLNESRSIIDLAREFDVPIITTHHMEGPWGFLNSPEQLLALGVLNSSIPIVFSHGTFISHQGVVLLRENNQYISITPESEMHYGHTHRDNHLSQDISSLGVDTHWTFSPDILTQARLWLQRTRVVLYENVLDTWHISPSNPMSVNQVFLLATRNGGLALRRPDLGVIREGAKADVVVWNGTSPSMLGWVDPVAAVILHASIGDIEHVLVDGKFVKRDGKLTMPNYSDIQAQFLESARHIQEEWRAMGVLAPLWYNNDTEFQDAMVVDVVAGEGDGYGSLFI